MSKHNRGEVANLFLHLGPHPIVDRVAALDACEIDAAADRQWFLQHPGMNRRDRPASLRELKAYALPAGATVIVTLVRGAQFRIFSEPNSSATN